MRYAREELHEPAGLGALLRGLIARHVDSVLLDPYANSFSFTPADMACNPGAWLNDNTTRIDPASGARVNAMRVGVFERKWEMDSLSSVLRLGRLRPARLPRHQRPAHRRRGWRDRGRGGGGASGET